MNIGYRIIKDSEDNKTSLYAVKNNQVYFKVHRVKEIINESPSSTRVLLNDGEIGLNVIGDQLHVSRTCYSSKGIPVKTYTLTKSLILGYSSESAINNAKRGIYQKLALSEIEEREKIRLEKIRREMKIVHKSGSSKTVNVKDVSKEVSDLYLKPESKIKAEDDTSVLEFLQKETGLLEKMVG
jgi:hypothetical protein